MTISASAKALGSRLPSPGERAAANNLRKILASRDQSKRDQKLRVQEEDGSSAEIILTPYLSELLMELLRPIGRGDAVTLVPVSQMLTTQQAADILNVSRPFFISLLEKGVVEFELVGRHRRIKAVDLFNYKLRRDAARAEALSDIAQLDADLI